MICSDRIFPSSPNEGTLFSYRGGSPANQSLNAVMVKVEFGVRVKVISLVFDEGYGYGYSLRSCLCLCFVIIVLLKVTRKLWCLS